MFINLDAGPVIGSSVVRVLVGAMLLGVLADCAKTEMRPTTNVIEGAKFELWGTMNAEGAGTLVLARETKFGETSGGTSILLN